MDQESLAKMLKKAKRAHDLSVSLNGEPELRWHEWYAQFIDDQGVLSLARLALHSRKIQSRNNREYHRGRVPREYERLELTYLTLVREGKAVTVTFLVLLTAFFEKNHFVNS